jgi:DNA-binding response OmpR family regulator
MKILIASASQALRVTCLAALRSGDTSPQLVRDGQKTLSRLVTATALKGSGPFDLLILHQELFKMKGLEVLRRIRADAGFNELQVIFIDDTLDHMEEAQMLSATFLPLKTVNQKILLAAIKNPVQA